MRKHFFWLNYFEPLTKEPREERIELALEGAPLPCTPLEEYLKTRGLIKFRKRLRLIRVEDRASVPYWYVPQSGDVLSCELQNTGGVV